jgi:hypothetical protein
LGASAVLAITFFTVREHESSPATSNDETVESVAIEAVSEREVDRNEITPSIFAVAPTIAASIAGPSDAPSVAIESSTVTPVPVQVVHSLPATAAESPKRDVDSATPSSQHIAASLASIRSSDALQPRTLLAVTSGFETRVMPPRAAIEPLQQMTSPSDTRRSRLLTAMVSTASMESSTRTTARAASRIDEERLYDRIQRFGARADQVQMKF